MIFRKTQNYILIIVTLIFFWSCMKEEEIIETKEESNIPIIEIGHYELLDESLDLLPYIDKIACQFIDSLGNEVIFDIMESPLRESTGGHLVKYNIFSEGDTVWYHYTNESKHFSLENDSLKFRFDFSLSAKPNYADPEMNYVADVVDIWLKNPDSLFYAHGVFHHLLNPRTWPNPTDTKSVDELTIINKTFFNVLYNDFSNPISSVKFNYEYGIISFTDWDKKIWRFEKFLE